MITLCTFLQVFKRLLIIQCIIPILSQSRILLRFLQVLLNVNYFYLDTKVDGALLVPLRSQPWNVAHFNAHLPILLVGIHHGKRESFGRAILFMAPLCLRTNSTFKEHHETFNGVQRNIGHCCAEQWRLVQGNFMTLSKILIKSGMINVSRTNI